MFNLNWDNVSMYIDEIEVLDDSGRVHPFYLKDWENSTDIAQYASDSQFNPRVWVDKFNGQELPRTNVLSHINNLANDLARQGKNPRVALFQNGALKRTIYANDSMYGKRTRAPFKLNIKRMI